MSQVIEITSTFDAAGLVGKLFSNGVDTVVATSSAVANSSNRKSIKIATFTGVAIGTYLLELQDANGDPVASRTVRITAASGTFTEIDDEPRTKAEDDAADTLIRDDIAALSTTGDGARTVTPTVRVSGSPLENATIRFTLGGLTYAGKTNASGQKVFNLDDGTYAVSISKPGYTFAGTTLVVNGTETPIYDVTLNTPSSPPGADDCDLSFIVASQSNTPLTSITIEAKYVKGFHVTEGTLGINAVESTTPNESGEVTLRLLRNAEYDISATRGTKKVTVRITTPDESTAVLDESMVV
jgi:hypothetical protein